MNQSDCEKQLKQLKKELAGKEKELNFLRILTQAYESVGEMATEELREAAKDIRTLQIMQQLAQKERLDDAQTIQAQEIMSKLAEQEMRHRDLTLRKILEVNRDISSILDRDLLLHKIVESLMETLTAHRGILFVHDKNGLTPTVFHGLDASELEKEYFRYSYGFIGESALKKESRMVTRQKIVIDGKETLISIICVPLIYESKFHGVLYLDIISEDQTFQSHDLETSEIFSSHAAISMENSSLYRTLEEKVEKRTKDLNNALQIMKEDLRLARRIQQEILPENLDKIKRFNFDIRYLPQGDVGGDIFDIFQLPDKRIRVFLADATGHGVQAAMVTMIIKAEYDRFKHRAKTPADLLNQLNHSFVKEYESLMVYFTAVIADIDPILRRITLTSAGHPDQLLITGQEITRLSSKESLAGTFDNVTYHNVQHPFPVGSKMLFFSDGFYEEFNAIKEEFGYDRLTGIVRRLLSRDEKASITDIINAIMTDLNDFMGQVTRGDDLTAIGLEEIPFLPRVKHPPAKKK